MRMAQLLVPAAGVAVAAIAVVVLQFPTNASVTPTPTPTRTSAVTGSIATAAPAQTTYSQGAEACLAEAIYFETMGTSLEAGQAVAHVVLNRREHEEFPQSVCEVIEDGCQFSYQCDGKPENMGDPEERARAFQAARTVLEGQADDPTGGALYFKAGSASHAWFDTLDKTAEIGGNTFYR